MSITQAQLNAGKADTINKTFLRYPASRLPIVRIVVQSYKNGNATEKEIAMALLCQAYQAIFGTDPNLNATTKHEFKHWLYGALNDNPDDQTTGVAHSDAFEAGPFTIT